MVSIISEIVDSLKICIPLAFLISLFFGYLYSKIKAKEAYRPTIKELTKNINKHTKGLKNTEKEYQKLKGEIEHYEYKLKGINESIFKYKDDFKSKKDLETEMLNKKVELQSKYEEKQNILAHYNGEIEQVKKECRLDDVSNIKENTDSMNRLIVEKEQLLKEKHNQFSMIQSKVKGLELDNRKLEEKFHELDKNSQNIALGLVEKKESLNGLEKSFGKEYDALYKKIALSHEKAKEYKEKLLKLKNL